MDEVESYLIYQVDFFMREKKARADRSQWAIVQ